jgi:hypothetical protein
MIKRREEKGGEGKEKEARKGEEGREGRGAKRGMGLSEPPPPPKTNPGYGPAGP